MRNHIPLAEMILFVLAMSLIICLVLVCGIAYEVFAQEPTVFDSPLCPQVCPACNVKAEWAGKAYVYEYTDGTAVITGTTPISVCWQAQGSYRVSSVCIKAGQMLFYPDPSDGCWTALHQDISHIVICTTKPTAIELVSFHASALGGFNIMLFLVGCVGMMLGLCIIAWAERRRR